MFKIITVEIEKIFKIITVKMLDQNVAIKIKLLAWITSMWLIRENNDMEIILNNSLRLIKLLTFTFSTDSSMAVAIRKIINAIVQYYSNIE